MSKYTNELFTAFTGKVNSSFTASIKKVNTALTGLGKSAVTVSKRFKKVNIGKFNQSMNSGAKSANSYSLALGNVGRAIQVIATFQLASSVIGGITGALSSGVDATIKYDQALKNLQAITGSTSQEIEVLGGTIMEVSNNTKFSSEEVANAAVVLGQAGFSATEVVQTLADVATLATGTLSDFKTTADLVATVLRSFEMEASDASHVADVLATSVNRSKLNLEELRTILSYVGAAAHLSGLSLEETSGAIQVLKNQGMKASTVATGLRNVLSTMAAPTTKLSVAMHKLGIEADSINPAVVGMEEAFKNLQPLLIDEESGLYDLGKAATYFNKRGMQTAMIMSRMANSGDYQKAVEQTNELGAAMKMQVTQQEGLELSIKNLQDRWKNLGVIIGEVGLTSLFKLLTDAASELALALAKPVQWYLKFEEVIGRATASGYRNATYMYKDYTVRKLQYEQMQKYVGQLEKLQREERKDNPVLQQKRIIIAGLLKDFPEYTKYIMDNAERTIPELITSITTHISRAMSMSTASIKNARSDVVKELDTLNAQVEQVFKNRETKTVQVMKIGGKSLVQSKDQLAALYSQIAGVRLELSKYDEALTPVSEKTEEVGEKTKKTSQYFELLGNDWKTLYTKLRQQGNYTALQTLISTAETTKKAIDSLIKSEEEITGKTLTNARKAEIAAGVQAAAMEKLKKSFAKVVEASEKLSKVEKQRIKNINTEYKARQTVLKEETKALLSNVKAAAESENLRLSNVRHNSAKLVQVKIALVNEQERIEKEAAQKSIDLEYAKFQKIISMRANTIRAAGGGLDDYAKDPTFRANLAEQNKLAEKSKAQIAAIGAEADATNAKLGVDLNKALEKNPDTFARAWTNALKHVNDQADINFTDIQGKIEDVTDEIGDGLTDSIVDFANGTKSASAAFADMAKSILADIQKMIVKMMVMKAIGAVMGMFGGGFSTTTSGTPYSSAGVNFMGGHHSGGTVGGANPSTVRHPIDPSMFINAPRFHSGGEVAAVLEEGEYVQTREDRLRSKDQGGDIKIEIKNESGTPMGATQASSSTTTMGDQVITIVVDALQRNKGGLRTAIQTVR